MRQFDFNITGQVRCSDGHCGKLAGVAVNPDTRMVTDVIVENGFLMKQNRVLPMDIVAKATEAGVFVYVSGNELDDFPEYRVVEYEEPATGLEQHHPEAVTSSGLRGTPEATVPMICRTVREGIVPGQVVIEEQTPVNNLEGTIGKPAHVLVDRASKKITHLVVRRGLIFIDYLVIPGSMIEAIHDARIAVAGTDETLAQLPRYKAGVEADMLVK